MKFTAVIFDLDGTLLDDYRFLESDMTFLLIAI